MGWFGDFLSGKYSVASGLLGTLLQNDLNARENQKNRDFNSFEAEKQRKWQSDEWSRQFEAQRSEWYNQLSAQQDAQYQQFLREAEYNSPQNQVARLAQAGLNPSAVLGQNGSTGLVSAATGNVHSSPSPSVPTGGTVSGASASASSPIPMQNPLQGLETVGSFMRDVAQATKDTTLLEPMVRLMVSQIYGQDLQNSLLETENFIKQANLPASIGKAYAEYEAALMDVTLKKSIDENYKADTLVKKAEELLKKAQAKCSDEQFKVLEFQVQHQLETWQADMKVKSSQAASNYGSAAYTNAMAASENAIREFKTKNAELLNDYQAFVNESVGNEAWLSTKLRDTKYQSMLKQLVESARQSGILSQTYQQQLDMAVKNNNWWLVNNLILPVMQQLDIKLPHQIVNSIPDKVSKVGSIIK